MQTLVMKADRVCHCQEENEVVLESPGGQMDLWESSGFVPSAMVAGSQLRELLLPACYNEKSLVVSTRWMNLK
ncbi:hypothetical protein GRJ2_001596000 [Grus japonensis]|uniref:Uncharacterized protein n=1 Tax=Grus japonensis TaxID=30415 RepID=A0ABC9X3H4_GRUJA